MSSSFSNVKSFLVNQRTDTKDVMTLHQTQLKFIKFYRLKAEQKTFVSCLLISLKMFFFHALFDKTHTDLIFY